METNGSDRLDDLQASRLIVAALRSDMGAMREALDTADAYLSGRHPLPSRPHRPDAGMPHDRDAEHASGSMPTSG